MGPSPETDLLFAIDGGGQPFGNDVWTDGDLIRGE